MDIEYTTFSTLCIVLIIGKSRNEITQRNCLEKWKLSCHVTKEVVMKHSQIFSYPIKLLVEKEPDDEAEEEEQKNEELQVEEEDYQVEETGRGHSTCPWSNPDIVTEATRRFRLIDQNFRLQEGPISNYP